MGNLPRKRLKCASHVLKADGGAVQGNFWGFWGLGAQCLWHCTFGSRFESCHPLLSVYTCIINVHKKMQLYR